MGLNPSLLKAIFHPELVSAPLMQCSLHISQLVLWDPETSQDDGVVTTHSLNYSPGWLLPL
jgi:hypothetical protein